MYGMTTEAAMRLGEAVRSRRTQLGLAQSDLRARGGPGQVVVGQIERGQQINPQALTLARLDKALEWPQGTAHRILSGEDVSPLEQTHTYVPDSTDHAPAAISDDRLLEIIHEIQQELERRLRARSVDRP